MVHVIARSGRPYSRRMTGIDTEHRVPRGRRGKLARRLAPDIGRPMDVHSAPFPLLSSFSFPRARGRHALPVLVAARDDENIARTNGGTRAECRRNRPTELGTFVDRPVHFQSFRGSFSKEREKDRERERERERESERRVLHEEKKLSSINVHVEVSAVNFSRSLFPTQGSFSERRLKRDVEGGEKLSQRGQEETGNRRKKERKKERADPGDAVFPRASLNRTSSLHNFPKNTRKRAAVGTHAIARASEIYSRADDTR